MDLHARRALALASASFLPGHPHKRFARRVAARVEAGAAPLSERQVAYLAVLAWRYRRQMPADLVPPGKPPDLPPPAKTFRAARSRAAPPGATAPGTLPLLSQEHAA